MSLPLAIVALSLIALVLIPVLTACQELFDSAYYAALLHMWNIQDKLHLFWFRHKTHKDTQVLNRSIKALEADPTDVPEPYHLQLGQPILYTQPPIRSNHVRNPRLCSPSRIHHEQGRSEHRSQRRVPQQCAQLYRERHLTFPTIFHVRTA